MKTKAYTQQRKGFGLVVTMFVMVVISALMALLIQSGGQQSFTARRMTNQIKSNAYAEAGFEYALGVIAKDWEKRFDAAACLPFGSASQSESSGERGSSATASYGEGTYTLSLKPLSNRYCLVRSVGVCGLDTSEVEVIVEDVNWREAATAPEDISGTAWEDTIFSAGTMNLGGSGDINGSLHSNGGLTMNGNVEIFPSEVDVSSSTKIGINGNVKSEGNYTAPAIRVSGNNESGATFVTKEVPQKAFPDYDLTELYTIAKDNGQVIDGDLKSAKYLDLSGIPGGVVWVNGNVRITADANLNCTLIATGYISITGNANWDAGRTENNHIISRDSYIKIAGNTEVNGLLYAPGDITLGGNARIYGQVISGSDVSINGNVDVINYVRSDPLGEQDPDKDQHVPEIVVSAWQK
ncbi:MAG TPA: hypothetical protein VIR63_06195 [Pontiella sp.]